MNSNGVLNPNNTGDAVTNDILISNEDTQISYLGLGNTGSYRISWFDNTDSLINTNTVSLSSGTISIPLTSTYFRFYFKRAADSNDVYDDFMLNFGLPLTYEPYEEKIISFNGINF